MFEVSNISDKGLRLKNNTCDFFPQSLAFLEVSPQNILMPVIVTRSLKEPETFVSRKEDISFEMIDVAVESRKVTKILKIKQNSYLL